jgi:hypothetical protein
MIKTDLPLELAQNDISIDYPKGLFAGSLKLELRNVDNFDDRNFCEREECSKFDLAFLKFQQLHVHP